MTIHDKYRVLQENLKALGSVAVAFSSGVDSTFLLKAAQEALGDKVIAVTASSCSFPKRELEEAKAFCEKNGICQIIVESEELDIDGFRQNPKNRCYLCKHELFEKIWEIAKENGMNAVAEGSNMDDNGDYRPGLIAVKELGVSSPLRQAELSKAEIRELSKEMGLPTWDKQSFACLSSRFDIRGDNQWRKSLAWLIKQSSFSLTWVSIRYASVSTEISQESKSFREKSQGSLKKKTERRLHQK